MIDVKASNVTLDHMDMTYDATYDREGRGSWSAAAERRSTRSIRNADPRRGLAQSENGA